MNTHTIWVFLISFITLQVLQAQKVIKPLVPNLDKKITEYKILSDLSGEYFVYKDRYYTYSSFLQELQSQKIKNGTETDPVYEVKFTTYKKVISNDSIFNHVNIFCFKLKDIASHKRTLASDNSTDPMFVYVSKLFPEFDHWKDIKDEYISSPDLLGKPSLLFFWNTEKDAATYHKEMNDLWEMYGNQVNFISFTNYPKSKARKIVKRYMFNYRHIADPKKPYVQILRANSYPKAILLNKHGVVLQVSKPQVIWGKPIDSNDLSKQIKRLLK